MLQNEKVDCNCSKVLADDYNGMVALTEKAINAGHRKIAVMSPSLAASTGTERLRGVLETLKKHRIKPSYQTVDGDYSYEFGQRAAREILSHAPETTFIIASNDMSAWGCVEKLRELGCSVPDDISVSGADGMWAPGPLHLSTFFSPSYEIGRLGAELLIKEVHKKIKTPESHILPVRGMEGNTIKIIDR
jgi:DNA-binding LacI/PurR family transcriptional regulator